VVSPWEFLRLKKRLINSPVVVSSARALLACIEAVVQTRRHAFLAVRESTRLAMVLLEHVSTVKSANILQCRAQRLV